MRATLSISLTLASLALAQTEVENSSTQTNPIEVTASRGPADDVPNLSDASALSTTINFSDLPTATITDNVFPGCETVTVAGEPMFSIQTDTVLPTRCTFTVYNGGSTTASDSTILVSIQPTVPLNPSNGTSVVTGGPGTATGNAANITSITVGQGLPSSGQSTTPTGTQASSTTGSGSASGSPVSQTGTANVLGMMGAPVGLAAVAVAAVLL